MRHKSAKKSKVKVTLCQSSGFAVPYNFQFHSLVVIAFGQSAGHVFSCLTFDT